MSPPTAEQALSFYRAALVTARMVDLASDPRTLDRDADAAWRAYGDDLPAVVRCDLVLRNFAMLYPAAFAPGPVFGLSGWYEDNPWGTGFERPPTEKVEALFAQRAAPSGPAEALDLALDAWGLGTASKATPDARITQKLTRAVFVVVCGTRAISEVVRAFAGDERLAIRAQVILVSAEPAARQLLGMASAIINREAGVPHFANLQRGDEESLSTWADREKKRLGIAQARLFVASSDEPEETRAMANALAHALGAGDAVDIVGT